jgi:hypothetical protein
LHYKSHYGIIVAYKCVFFNIIAKIWSDYMKKTVHTEITLLSSKGKETVPATFYYIEDEEGKTIINPKTNDPAYSHCIFKGQIIYTLINNVYTYYECIGD